MKKNQPDQDFAYGKTLVRGQILKGPEVSIHEFEPGLIGISQSGMMLKHSPLFSNSEFKDITLTQVLKELVTRGNVKDISIHEAEQRVIEAEYSLRESKKRIQKLKSIFAEEQQEQWARSKNRKIRNMPDLQSPELAFHSSQHYCGRNVGLHIPIEEFPIDYDADAVWFEDQFCRTPYGRSFPCTNVMEAYSFAHADWYSLHTGCNASFDANAYFAGDYWKCVWGNCRWSSLWEENIRPRYWHQWFVDGGGTHKSAIFGYGDPSRNLEGMPRVHHCHWKF